MGKCIDVKPQGWLGRFADLLMVPWMYFVSGTFREKPQRTHFWNNRALTKDEVTILKPTLMCEFKGIEGEFQPGSFLPVFHMPVFGGWRNYVVLVPQVVPLDWEVWYVGWITNDTGGVSQIPLTGAVRMLIGPGDVQFFAVNEDGKQIKLFEHGRGRTGSGGRYRKIPLF